MQVYTAFDEKLAHSLTCLSEDEIFKQNCNPHTFIQMEISHPGVQGKQSGPSAQKSLSPIRVRKKLFD